MVLLGDNNRFKGFIIVGLLFCLFVIGVMLMFRNNTQQEGFETEDLRFVNENVFTPPAGLQISVSDSNNGYYITQRDSNGTPTKIGQLPYGYYKVSENKIAKIPYRYKIDNQGTTIGDTTDYMSQLVPKTNTAKYYNQTVSGVGTAIPQNGDIPEGYYKLNSIQMSFLPPNTKPNITNLRVLGTFNSPTLVKTFGVGYINETEYYNRAYKLKTLDGNNNEADDMVGNPPIPIKDINIADIGKLPPGEVDKKKTYPRNDDVFPLPPGVYYIPPPAGETIWKPNAIQFLPYGKLANTLQENGTFLYGYKDNPDLISKDGTFKYSQDYKDISNNLDVTFHDSIDMLKQQNDTLNENTGSITVLDKEGNLVVLPRSEIQGDISYYTPGSYTFGAGTYIPKYEDSVYLSRTSNMPTMAEYKSAFQKAGFCESTKDSPYEQEAKCNSIDPNTCASTSCCVLFGGSKCVSGNETGPIQHSNYSDVLVRNKDYYMHMGKCYGNCQ